MKISKRDALLWFQFFAALPEDQPLGIRQQEIALAVFAQIETAAEAQFRAMQAEIPGLKPMGSAPSTYFVGPEARFPGGCRSCLLGTGPVRPVPVESGGRVFPVVPVGMGNPHAVVLAGPEDCDPARYGAEIEKNPGFPEGANVEFVTPEETGRLRVRVWERGSGVTMACGTGACASLVAACLLGCAPREAVIALDGGELTCRWEETGRVFMRGPAAYVFEGEWPDA